MMPPLIWWAIGLCVLVAATNRYEGAPRADAVPSDAWEYFRLAEAAPTLAHEPLAYHHVQRLAIPYLLGLLHDVSGMPLHALFLAAVLLFALSILVVLAVTLRRLGVDDRQAAVVLAIVALNPWAFRLYLTFPEMIPDLGFVLGVALLLRGLVTGTSGVVLAGQAIASLSRQTALALVPVVLLWIWRDRVRSNRLGRSGLGLGTAAIAVGLYAGTAWLAAGVSTENTTLQHVTGLFTWARTQFDGPTLLAFALRGVLPALAALACLLALAGTRRHTGLASDVVPLLVLAAVCIGVQPVLGGPELTAGNGPRLLVLGLPPLALALGIVLRDARVFSGAAGWARLRYVVLLLVVGSLHHWYVLAAEPGLRHKVFFGAAYAGAAAGCYLLLARERQQDAPRPIAVP
jgi:hypothetical protein